MDSIGTVARQDILPILNELIEVRKNGIKTIDNEERMVSLIRRLLSINLSGEDISYVVQFLVDTLKLVRAEVADVLRVYIDKNYPVYASLIYASENPTDEIDFYFEDISEEDRRAALFRHQQGVKGLIDQLRFSDYNGFIDDFADYIKVSPYTLENAFKSDLAKSLAFISKGAYVAREDFITLYGFLIRLPENKVNDIGLKRGVRYYDETDFATASKMLSAMRGHER